MKSKYFNSGIKIMILLMAGKIIGFIKQLIVGWIFGADINTDIFFMAEGFVASINNAIFAAFAVTFLRNYIVERKKNQESANTMASDTLFMGAFSSLIVMGIFDLLIPVLSKVLAPGYTLEQMHLLEKFMLFLSPVILIYSITSVLGAILDGEELFIFSKLSGIVTSISYIVICVIWGRKFSTFSLVIANIVGYVLYFSYLIIVLHKKTGIRLLKPKWDKKVIKTIELAAPVMLGNAVTDLNAIIDKTIASDLTEGSVSALYYGQIASNDLINGVFIYAIGSILITYFTGLALESNNTMVKKRASKVMSFFVILLVPIAIIFVALGDNIAVVLFGHGALSDSKTSLIADCMKGYAVGFPFLAIREVLIKIHYSYNDMKRPMINGCIAIGINIVLSIVLAKPLGVFGITVASSFSIIIAIILLEKTVNKLTNMYIFPDKRNILQIVFAGVAAVITIMLFNYFFKWYGLTELVVSGLTCAFVYLVVLFLMKNALVMKCFKKISTRLKK